MFHVWLQIILTLLIGFVISIPTGRYLAKVVTGAETPFDRVFDPLDAALYTLIGRHVCTRIMDWKSYTLHMLATNLVMAVFIFLILAFQEWLPLNPRHLSGMDPILAFNTAISFITNTDWQAYSGETSLSNFSQMAAITFPMFTSATTGFVVAMAFIRAFTIRDGSTNLGNFYRDFVRFTTRVLLPVSFVLALLMIQQGEPQTLAPAVVAHTPLEAYQTIPLGPVASLETIKHLGTNGGGFFNANAAHPFENPTPLTNLIQTLLMIILPSSIVLCFGEMIGSRRQAWILYGVMAAMVIMFLPVVVTSEQAGTRLLTKAGIDTRVSDTQPGGNMEGKEVRFGIAQSATFASVTTLFTTGSVNSMHDSYTPLGGLGTFVGMMLQCVFGGKGVGFLAALVFGIIGVFLAGLMVGHTPQFLGKKIGKPEIVLVSLTLLIHPLAILAPTGWSVVAPYGIAAMGNAGMHGYSEVLYAFTTSAANNGSAFAGLNGNTVWYNLATAAVILIGRYPPIIFMMALAGSVAVKPIVPTTSGTLRTDTLKFGVFWLGTILVIGALTFVPALVLGPIAEFFALKSGLLF